MLCPMHRIAMLSQQSGGVQFECCSTCNGVWFGPRHLLTLDLPPNLYPKGLRAFALASSQALPSPAAACDDCGKDLLSATIEGVGVNICPSCGGAWLPAMEFERVLAWYEGRRKNKDDGADYDPGPSDQDPSQRRDDGGTASADEWHGSDRVPAASSEACGPDEGTLTALIDYVSMVCRGVGNVASAIGDAASAIGDAIGDADFDGG